MAHRFARRLASLLGLLPCVAATPAAALVDLVGTTSATFEWSASSGPAVTGYAVYVIENGAFPTQVSALVAEPRATVHADPGDTIQVVVVGFVGPYLAPSALSPASQPSESVRFVAAGGDPPSGDPPGGQPPGGGPPGGGPGPGGATAAVHLFDFLTGALRRFEVDGTTLLAESALFVLPPGSLAVAAGDYDGDGDTDFVVRELHTSQTSSYSVRWIEGSATVGATALPSPPAQGALVGSGDFDGDGTDDLLWQAGRDLRVWLLREGGASVEDERLWTYPGAGVVEVAGTLDADGDGHTDILLRHLDGRHAVVLVRNGAIVGYGNVTGGMTLAVGVRATGDFDGDGRDDLVLTGGGLMFALLLRGLAPPAAVPLGTLDPGVGVVGAADLDANGTADLLLSNLGGEIRALLTESGAVVLDEVLGDAGVGWALIPEPGALRIP